MLIAESLTALTQRLRNTGMVYVDRDHVSDLDWSGVDYYVLRRMSGRRFDAYQHTETARAMIRVVGDRGRQTYRHFRWAPGARPHEHLFKWCIDPIGQGGGPESTASPVAESLTLITGGLVYRRLRTRLWFLNLPSLIFACSWPWVLEWGRSDLYLALTRGTPFEMIADWVGVQGGHAQLSDALIRWHRANEDVRPMTRLAAALALFEATEPLRMAGGALIERQAEDWTEHREAFNEWDRWVWTGGKGPEPEVSKDVKQSPETAAALEHLLSFGKGCPRRDSTPKIKQAMVG